MSGPRRVLYVRVDGCFGGPERHILCLLKHLDRSRYMPHVAPLVREAKLAERARELGVPVTVVPMPSRLSIRKAREALTSIIRTTRIDLVHTFGIRSNLVAGPLAHRLGLPWLARVPNLNYTDYRDPLRGWFFHTLNNRLLRRADAVHAVSRPLKEYLESLPHAPTAIELIPSGIDLPAPADPLLRARARDCYGLGDDQIVIGSLGRLEPIKGYDLLLDTLPDLPAQCSVLIGGQGSDMDRLARKAQHLGQADRFRLVGFVDDIRRFLAACDIYAQPSRSEGIPHSLLEAMAMSLPVVATAVGGIADIIRDGREGMLVHPGDGLALKERLRQLTEDPPARFSLGRQARRRVEETASAEAMTRRLERLYDRLLFRTGDR